MRSQADAAPKDLTERGASGVDELRHRYLRAARLTAPKFALENPGTAVEGYWLDEWHYYYLAETFEAALGTIVATPSVVDCRTLRVQQAIPLGTLAELLSKHRGKPIDIVALASAVFDMRDTHSLGVSVGGYDYVVDTRERSIRESRESLKRPGLYSPDGRYVCFVNDHNLWLQELATGDERPLTIDGSRNHAYGEESESNFAAVSYRKQPVPVALWSRDSQWLLTHQIDERAVPEWSLLESAPQGGGRPILHRYRCPVPGEPMPMATFVAIHIGSGRLVRFDAVPTQVHSYSPFSLMYRMVWFGGADHAWYLRTDRYSKQAELIELSLARGAGRIAIKEAADFGYLDLHPLLSGRPNVRTLDRSDEVIWYSERSGWGHLYLYEGSTGRMKGRITRGEWMVRDIVFVDEDARRILFTACGMDAAADPAKRALCTVNLDGTGLEVLLRGDDDIVVPKAEPAGLSQDRPFRWSHALPGVAPRGRFAAVRTCSVLRGDETKLVDLHTRAELVIASVRPRPEQISALPFTAVAADGVTRLHGVMFRPSDFSEQRIYPLIDYVYPGPHVSHQPQSFGSMNAAFAKAVAELGFVTVMLDTRGMPLRSRALHQSGYGGFLEPQLSDHAAVLRQLCDRHAFLDRERVGVVGYSAGGAAAARAMFEYPDLFIAGASVCGCHDNALMASMWSDKYRGGDPSAWVGEENGAAAHKLEGKLLLISGDMDENVHITQTYGLVNALIRANRDFDLLVVPNGGHSVLITNGYVQRRVWDYFVRHLLRATPPQDFGLEFRTAELNRLEENYARERRLWR